MLQTFDSEQLALRFPFLHTNTRDENMTSDKFAPIETMPVIQQLEQQGFKTYSVQQDRSRTNNNHARHAVSMINYDVELADNTFEQAILMNGSNGTKSFQLAYGGLRGYCFNSCFFGNITDSLRVIHKGDAATRAIDTVTYMLEQRKQKMELITDMEAIDIAGAKDKLALVMKKLRPAYEFTAINRLMQPRRQADRNNSLFTLYNIAQEGLVRGNILQGNFRRSRPVRSTTEQARLNRGIWSATVDIFEGNTPAILEQKAA